MTMAKKTTKKTAAKRLKITLVRSTIGFNKTQAETVRGLGLRRLHHTVERLDTPETRGMIHKVQHLVTVE
jgi:large subunit ribosomal protein L30